MWIKPDVNLHKIKNIVFFDIDQTLSDSIRHCMISEQRYYAFLEKFKLHGYKHINPADAIYLNQTSVELLAELMKIDGTYAICISSWGGKGDAIAEITHYFGNYADFPDGWLIGSSSGLGGDRYTKFVAPFLKEEKFKGRSVIIDDGAHAYANNPISITVDGRIGFSIYDFVQALDILNIDSVIHNPQIDFQVQRIRESAEYLPIQPQ